MPLTAAHLATLAAFTDKVSLIAVDYLLECEATLPEVLLAYAGTSPDYTDGLPHEALWEWLKRTEPWWWVNRGVLRWEAVRDTLPVNVLPVDSSQIATSVTHAVQELYRALFTRDRKRRVLTLFPEVRLPCPTCGGMGHVEAKLRAGRVDCRHCKRSPAEFRRPQSDTVPAFGTVAAPDLIPPEPIFVPPHGH